MINLRNSPFLWLALILLISLRAAQYEEQGINAVLNIGLWIICGICCILTLVRYTPRHQFVSTIVIGILIFIAGLIRSQQFEEEQFPGQVLAKPIYLEGMVKVDQVLKNKNSSVSIKCKRIFLSSNGDPDGNKIEDRYLLVFIKSPSVAYFFPGDILMVRGLASAIAGPLNPYAFDARAYYKTIGIRQQLYCKGNEILKDSIPDKSIIRLTAQWQYALSALVKNHISAQVAQLTNALVWGDRSDMDNDVRDAFADSGAMHVLSVSGMHVAIIYSMLFFFLGAPGSGNFAKRLLRFVSYTIAILLYVGLTGACPAVLRAGLMIILFLFGKAMGWNTQVWNLLGFAAFMMMWFNPHVWENIGFQLSFLAMAGILLYSKPMIRSLSFKSKILHLIWEVTVLSIVAQVFILPILLGQFHQFPLTFIISSLVAIPAGYLIVFGAMLNVVLSFLGINLLWPLLDWIGQMFIQCMKWMGGLNPEMYFSLPSWSGIFLMAMAILFTIVLVFKWPGGKSLAYGCGAAALVIMSCHRMHQWSENEMIIYHSYKGLITDITYAGRCISIHDCDVPASSIEFSCRGYRCHRDIINVADVCIEQDFMANHFSFSSSIFTAHKSSVLIWEGKIDSVICEKKLSHLIIDQCSDTEMLKEFISDRRDMMVVIPAHVDRESKKVMTEFLTEQQITFHDIDLNGYYKIPI